MPHFSALEPEQAAAIADELVDLTRRLSELAYDLGSDSHTVRTHMHSLQAIDLITQIQLSLADLLRSPAPFADRLHGITVQALSDRMRARMTASRSDESHFSLPVAAP